MARNIIYILGTVIIGLEIPRVTVIRVLCVGWGMQGLKDRWLELTAIAVITVAFVLVVVIVTT
jgi:hypothetical protein